MSFYFPGFKTFKICFFACLAFHERNCDFLIISLEQVMMADKIIYARHIVFLLPGTPKSLCTVLVWGLHPCFKSGHLHICLLYISVYQGSVWGFLYLKNVPAAWKKKMLKTTIRPLPPKHVPWTSCSLVKELYLGVC